MNEQAPPVNTEATTEQLAASEPVKTEEVKKYKVSITKGSINITLDRADLIEVKETPDGIVFNFKNGLHLIYSEQNMPLETKGVINQAVTQLQNVNLDISLDYYNKPVRVKS